MIEVVFGVIILALIAWHYWHVKELSKTHGALISQVQEDKQQALVIQQDQHESVVKHLKDIITDLSKERVGDKANMSKMINALVAKTTQDVKDLNLTDKISVIKPTAPEPETPP